MLTDMERKFIYSTAIRMVWSKMARTLERWDSFGDPLTEGEMEEIDRELDEVGKQAGRAAVIVKTGVMAAKRRTELSLANDVANDQGFVLASSSEVEDEDDDPLGSNKEDA